MAYNRDNSDPFTPEVLGPDDGSPSTESMGLDPITRSEIDMQITTAKRYPRDLARVKKDIVAMATLDQATAESCFYSLARKGGEGGGKNKVQGPSIRLAEIALTQYCNIRAATRTLGESEDGRFIRALGVVHDVEKNVMVAREVSRRITTRDGRRYGDDMVGVTLAAAGAIALRNAVFTVVPRAIILPAYEAAVEVALGKAKSLTVRREEVIASLKKIGPWVTIERILAAVERRSAEELTWDDLRDLLGLKNAIRDGQTTVEDAFPDPSAATAGAPPMSVGEILNGPGGGAPPAAGAAVAGGAEEPAEARLSAAQLAELHGLADRAGVSWSAVEEHFDGPLEELVGTSAGEIEALVVAEIRKLRSEPAETGGSLFDGAGETEAKGKGRNGG